MPKRTKLSFYLEMAAWTLALLFLIGVILYYNVFYNVEIPQGYEIGEVCPDFEIEIYKSKADPDGGAFSPQDSRGKVTVLNFWYTNCGPCLQELPDFDAVQKLYPEEVKIVAIHSYSVDTWVDKQAFIDTNFTDYQISFGQDTSELKLFDHLGGTDSYPMTVILDREGVIRFSQKGKLQEGILQGEVEKLL